MPLTLRSLSLILGLSFFCSCYRNDPWQNLKIKSGHPQFTSSRLLYPATQFSHDLELEFLYVNGMLHGYINVYLEEIPPYNHDEKVASIYVETKKEKLSFLVERLSGGQRLKIPEDQLSFFVHLLEQNSSLTLYLTNSYKTKIHAKDFKKHFKKLKTIPLTLIPNRPIGLAL